MKFTQNTPVISPNTIGNVAVRVSGDPMAYGTGGKEYGAMAGAIGQMAKIAQQEQDDKDAADTMEARNRIMGSLTESMYGEKGILTNGIGEKAKGLQERVHDTVQKTFDNISKGYNSRVQRALRGNLSENMGNFLRIAANQEGREFRKQKDSQYGITLDNSVNRAMLNYQDADLLDSNINDVMNIVDYRAKDQGFSEMQRQQERRRVLTAVVTGAMQSAIDNSDLDTASIYADRYGKYMEQSELTKFQKVLRQEKRLTDEKNEIEELTKTILNASGEPDWTRIEQEIRKRAKQTKVVGGGGSGVYSGDAQTDALIQKYAEKYNLPVDLFAALGDVESGFNNGAQSGVGARGIYQLMPDTAASLGVDPDTLEGNIEGGAKYLRQMLDTFGGNEDLAIAAYNAGPGAVKDAGNQIPNYEETQNHVKKVRERREKYKGTGGNVNIESAVNKAMGDIDRSVPLPEGRNGCAHAANYIAAYYDPWSKKQIEKGGLHMSYVPQLVEDARQADGPGVIDFDESKLRKGNMIVYKDPEDPEGMNHVVVYMGNGSGDYRYVGNSSEANGGRGGIINDGQDYREMSGMKPQYIIKTGGNAGIGGHTVNAHDSGYEDRMIRRLEAARSDWMRRKKDETTNRLQGYQSQIKNAGSAANALSILERIKSSEQDPDVYSAAVTTAKLYYPDAFKVSNSVTGTRRSHSSSNTAESRGENAADIMAVELGSGRKVRPETLVKVRNYNRLNQEDWDYLHSDKIQASLADMLDNNGGDLQATYNQLAAQYGERAAAQILATADDGYFE